MAETDDHPTEILLSRARLYVARYTDSTPAAERLILDKLADWSQPLPWLYHQARIEGGPAPQTLHHLTLQLAAMYRLPPETPLVVWGSEAVRKCFWLRPEPNETLEVYWEQSRAVRLSPPLISVPDGEGGSYPVRFSNYPVMTIEVDIVRLLRTELDAMLRRAGLMAPLAAPPSPSPPPSLDQRGSFKVPQRGTLQAKVFEAAVVNNSARLYDDGLAEKLLKEFGYDKGGNSYSRTYKTTSNYIGELRRAVREGRLDLSHYSKT